MSGGDSQEQSQTQNSQTNPWAPAIPALTGILGKLGGQNTDVTGAQQTAANTLMAGASGVPSFGADASATAQKLFGSDTSPQVGMLSDALKQYQTNIGGTASGADLDPYKTPGFADAINTATNDITNKVKGVYAGSGRDPSGAGSFAKTLGRGLTEGIAPTIAAQFNTNNANRMGAAKSLYDASGGTAGAITGQQQVPLSNAAQGVGLLPQISQAFTQPGATQLAAANTAAGLPYENLMKQIAPLLGIAGLGNTSSGTASGTTTQNPSLMSNIMGGTTGALALMSMFSDERLKDDVEKVGKLDDGQDVYRYRMKGSPKFQIGLLAQEVEKNEPGAVSTFGGFRMVDYKKATDRAAMKEAA